MTEYKLPEQILFNYEELKQELTKKVSMYETLVYTEDNIKEAKNDRANLNKLKKALNDERIRREKEYLQPFNDFKSKINEIIGIIDKPVQVIDKQVKAFEEQKKQEKASKIDEIMKQVEKELPDDMHIPFDDKWLNASVSMKSIETEIKATVEGIKENLATLSNLPEFGFEATQIYKSTLDINKALNEGKRLSEIAKAKAAHEAELARIKAEKEAKAVDEEVVRAMNPPVEEPATMENTTIDGVKTTLTFEEQKPAKQWIAFQALLSTDDALALKQFFNDRNIEFKAV